MAAFAISIFLSAFLLFTVQPMLAKKLLPWFGGSPAVWLSNMLFFQVILLFGYLYAFLLTKIPRNSWQVLLHFSLLTLSLFFLPLTPQADQFSSWLPINIILVLNHTLFLPGLMLSASSPLLQHWFYRCYRAPFPYRYYAYSNLGSLLGLLAYPFAIEPLLGLVKQIQLWSILFGVFLLGVIACLIKTLQLAPAKGEKEPGQQLTSLVPHSPSYSAMGLWVLFTFLSNALLLSTTQFMLQNIAGFPLLWVLPLALYLITFIITFSRPQWYYRSPWLIILSLCIICITSLLSHHQLNLALQILVFSSLLFAGCMICHGELIRLKPDPHYLTTYYLAIALGGVFGGVFINLIAPLIFNSWLDFYLIVGGIFILGATAFHLGVQKFRYQLIWPSVGVVLCILTVLRLDKSQENVIFSQRNFFGMLEVTENHLEEGHLKFRQLRNGSILHGLQFIDLTRRFDPTTYYTRASGLSLAIDFERILKLNQPYYKGLRIGVIGLGVGTISSLTMTGDFIRFYEIDPEVVDIAKKYFYYLSDSKGLLDVVIGDGRLALKQTVGSEQYDVLVIDAFSGDAIPIHLLTQEALDTYLYHLAPRGILAFHISSRYINLYPPLQALATQMRLFAYLTHNSMDYKSWTSSSEWVLISRENAVGHFLYENNALLFRPERTHHIWTDDYSYLWSQIKW